MGTRTDARELAQRALQDAQRLTKRGIVEGWSLTAMIRAGMVGGGPPRQTIEAFRALNQLGQLGAAVTVASIRHPERVGLVDELGPLTFRELDDRSDALAAALADLGITEHDAIGILCRNHRGFVDISFAATKLGARVLYLNTDFAAPQLRDVCAREEISLLVHDEEYRSLVGAVSGPPRIAARVDRRSESDETRSRQLIAAGAGRGPDRRRVTAPASCC